MLKAKILYRFWSIDNCTNIWRLAFSHRKECRHIWPILPQQFVFISKTKSLHDFKPCLWCKILLLSILLNNCPALQAFSLKSWSAHVADEDISISGCYKAFKVLALSPSSKYVSQNLFPFFYFSTMGTHLPARIIQSTFKSFFKIKKIHLSSNMCTGQKSFTDVWTRWKYFYQMFFFLVEKEMPAAGWMKVKTNCNVLPPSSFITMVLIHWLTK